MPELSFEVIKFDRSLIRIMNDERKGQKTIELPADIQALASVGTEVPLEGLSAGDIIIYSSADGENKFFHAAVYDGSGRVIHASNMKTGIELSDYDYREISKAIRMIG